VQPKEIDSLTPRLLDLLPAFPFLHSFGPALMPLALLTVIFAQTYLHLGDHRNLTQKWSIRNYSAQTICCRYISSKCHPCFSASSLMPVRPPFSAAVSVTQSIKQSTLLREFHSFVIKRMHLVSEALLRFTVGPRTSSENVPIDELYSLASSVSSLVTWVFACKPDLTNCSSWNLGLHLCLFSRSTSPLVIAGLTVVIVRPTVLCFPEFTSPHSISRSGIRTTGIYTKE